MGLQCVHHAALRVVKLGPDLDSEHVLTGSGRLVKETNATEHCSITELVSNNAEDELFPDCLKESDARLKVDSELSTMLVDLVLPLRLNVLLEETQSAYAHHLAFHVHTAISFRLVKVLELLTILHS